MSMTITVFESDVVLGISLTRFIRRTGDNRFESDVVLGISLTATNSLKSFVMFESDVVLGISLTQPFLFGN